MSPAPLITDKTQPPEDGTKPRSLGTAAKLKALMSSLLFSGATAGRPLAIHLPWNKARIEPVEVEGRGKVDSGDAVKRNNIAARQEEDERIKIWRSRADMEPWARLKTGAEGFRAEHRGELPGFLVNGGLVRSDQQGSAEVAQTVRKQKLNDNLGLISLNRRFQGSSRVGGATRGRKMYDSVGDMSISALVSGRGYAAERGRWRRQVGGGFSERCHMRPRLLRDDSQSEFSPSDSNVPSSSVSTEREETESETESQSKSGSQDDEGDSERETGSESDEREDSGVQRSVSRKDVQEGIKRREGTKENLKNKTEDLGYSSASKGKAHRDSSNEDQKEKSPPQTIDLSDALSPIMEDTEEETSA